MLSIIPKYIADDVCNDLRNILQLHNVPKKKNPFR